MVQGGLTFPEPLISPTYNRILNKHGTANSEKQVFDFFNTSQFHCAWRALSKCLQIYWHHAYKLQKTIANTGRFLSTLWGETHFS